MTWEIREVIFRYKKWIEHYQPSEALQRHVLEAIKGIAHNPYAAGYNGAFYFAALPGCVAANGDHVTCTWEVFPRAHIIRVATLTQQQPPVEFQQWEEEVAPPDFL